jgi:N-acetylglutamate synthase-like GNAT family acetyltransferase
MILTATSGHVKAVTQLTQACLAEFKYTSQPFDYDIALDFIRKSMIYALSNVVVAEWDNKIVGFNIAFVIPYTFADGLRCNMESFYVLPQYRTEEHGLEKQLLEHQIRWAQKMGAKEIYGGDFNPAAFKSTGFESIGLGFRKEII